MNPWLELIILSIILICIMVLVIRVIPILAEKIALKSLGFKKEVNKDKAPITEEEVLKELQSINYTGELDYYTLYEWFNTQLPYDSTFLMKCTSQEEFDRTNMISVEVTVGINGLRKSLGIYEGNILEIRDIRKNVTLRILDYLQSINDYNTL